MTYKTKEEILSHHADVSIDGLSFAKEVQIIRPSEALEAMDEYSNQNVLIVTMDLRKIIERQETEIAGLKNNNSELEHELKEAYKIINTL